MIKKMSSWKSGRARAATEATKPKEIKVARSELPPEDKKGKVMPVIGVRPKFIPKLIKIWVNKEAKTPIHTK